MKRSHKSIREQVPPSSDKGDALFIEKLTSGNEDEKILALTMIPYLVESSLDSGSPCTLSFNLLGAILENCAKRIAQFEEHIKQETTGPKSFDLTSLRESIYAFSSIIFGLNIDKSDLRELGNHFKRFIIQLMSLCSLMVRSSSVQLHAGYAIDFCDFLSDILPMNEDSQPQINITLHQELIGLLQDISEILSSMFGKVQLINSTDQRTFLFSVAEALLRIILMSRKNHIDPHVYFEAGFTLQSENGTLAEAIFSLIRGLISSNKGKFIYLFLFIQAFISTIYGSF